jgi:hypothetical protein
VRDNFSRQTIAQVAKGVGYRCSNPDCARATVGANAEQDGIISIGVAAHIHAAAAGGPRFDAAQGADRRRAKENGIWLCQNCGRLVDVDPQKFTVELLHAWKRVAQERAFRELLAPASLQAPNEAERVSAAIEADNARTGDRAFDTLFLEVQEAARRDLLGFKRSPIWLADSIELTLRLDEENNSAPFSISRLPIAVEVASEVTIVAPPGMGKSTTLLQLAEYALSGDLTVPLYFRLGEWSADTAGLFAGLKRRAAFRDMEESKLRSLAAHGRRSGAPEPLEKQ